MHARFAIVLGAAFACAAAPAPVQAETPVPVVVRNLGRGVARVQIAMGTILPCDSRENTMLFDGRLRPGETRVLAVPLGTVHVCARNTANGSTLDWGPSEWRIGGVTCTGPRRRWCVADARVPIRVDVAG